MLGGLATHEGAVSALRFVAPDKAYRAVLEEMGVSDDDMDESVVYFGSLDATPESGLAWIFDRRGQIGKLQGRFTDGSIPVYYTALDQHTAQAETARWLQYEAASKYYFRLLNVEFLGEYVDLRELESLPKFLTAERSDGAYDKCLLLTREAVEFGIDAFKTPSARLTGGCCFPIFSRNAIHSVSHAGYVSFEYIQNTGGWTCRPLS